MTFKKSLKSVATFVFGAGLALNSMFVTSKIEAFPVEFYQQQCETYRENPLILRTLYLVLLMTHDKHALAASQTLLRNYRTELNDLFRQYITTISEWERRAELYNLFQQHSTAEWEKRKTENDGSQKDLAISVLEKAHENYLLNIELTSVLNDIEELYILTDQLGTPKLTPENYTMKKQQMEEKFLTMMEDMTEDARYKIALKLTQQEIYGYLYGGSNPDEQCANEAANRLPTNPETLRKLCTDLLKTIKPVPTQLAKK